MDQKDLVTVYTVSNPIAAEVIVNFLRGKGIRSFTEGEDQAALQGLDSMEIKILVPALQADRARKLIHEHEPHKK